MATSTSIARNSVTTAVCFLTTLLAWGQQVKVDSLESLVTSLPTDTPKVWLLNQLVETVLESDNRKAMTYALQAKELSELLNFDRGLANSLLNLGWIHYRRGDFSKALELSTQGLKLSERIHDHRLTALARNSIAAVFYEEEEHDLAIANFKESLKVATKIADEETRARCLNNIAYTFMAKTEVDSALHYALKALKTSEANNLMYTKAYALRTLGDVWFSKKQFEAAQRNYDQCQRISTEIDNPFLLASVVHRLGKFYTALQEYEKAIALLEGNIVLAKRHGFADELERSHRVLADIFHAKKEWEKAWNHQSIYVSLRDSLHSRRKVEQLALMQIRFDTELKQAQIEFLTKEAALKAEQIKRQQAWIYFSLGCLLLLVILAFVLFYNYHFTRKAKVALEEKNSAFEIQAEQLRNLNSTKDKLFSIISHDLRSPISSLKALMEIVNTDNLTQDEFVSITKVLKRNLDSVFEDLNSLLLWARSQLSGLVASPTEVSMRALVDEKIRLFADDAARKGLRIVNGIPEDVRALADRDHVGLVIRNLLANGIKYNRAGGVIDVQCEEAGDAIEIAVSDNGIGMSPEDIDKLFREESHFSRPGTNNEKGLGIGLLLAKEFIERNGGRIGVHSIKGQGTTFRFTLPASMAEAPV